jgi:hypothetical protein
MANEETHRALRALALKKANVAGRVRDNTELSLNLTSRTVVEVGFGREKTMMPKRIGERWPTLHY